MGSFFASFFSFFGLVLLFQNYPRILFCLLKHRFHIVEYAVGDSFNLVILYLLVDGFQLLNLPSC